MKNQTLHQNINSKQNMFNLIVFVPASLLKFNRIILKSKKA